MDYIAEFHNAETNVTGLVYPLRGEFAAALRDDDVGQILPHITIHRTVAGATAEAMRSAGFPCGEKLLCDCPQGVCAAA
jgi:hypothetical protein